MCKGTGKHADKFFLYVFVVIFLSMSKSQGLLLLSLLPFCLLLCGYEFEHENNYIYAFVDKKNLLIKKQKLHKNLLKLSLQWGLISIDWSECNIFSL